MNGFDHNQLNFTHSSFNYLCCQIKLRLEKFPLKTPVLIWGYLSHDLIKIPDEQ